MAGLRITGGSVLRSDTSTFATKDVVVVDGHIAVDGGGDPTVIDATGCLVLPGIVDVHGDAFERCVMPRPGVLIDVATGLADNDPHLLAAGITTAYISVTDSWEPGLRSRQMLRELLAANRTVAGGPDRLVHVRHECCNTDDFDELIDWVETGQVSMFSYNDHTPGGILHTKRLNPARASRAGMSVEDFTDLQDAAVARRPLGMEQYAALAETCRTASCPTASHDAGSQADFERDLALGVAIAEFPITIELAQQYIANGIEVLLGAPNLVRGGSHLNNLSVRDAIEANAVTLVCSDYHYPSLLRSPFVVADHGLATLGDAWRLVSEIPARVAGLDDRGRLDIGARADVIVVEPGTDGVAPHVRAAVVAGEVVSTSARR